MAMQNLMNVLDCKRIISPLYTDLSVVAGDKQCEEDESALYAVYSNDEDAPVSLCAIDPHFCAYMGGALTMVPVAAANEAAENADFSELMLGNIYEVMNILSRLFMEGSSPHIRLIALRKNASELFDGEKAILGSCADRLDLKMNLPQYGESNCSLITL